MFELVEDPGCVAAAINYYVFRGRVRHPLKHTAVARLARRIGVFDAAYGPSRFYFGELFASDRTGAPPQPRRARRNDTQAAAIGRWLVTRDGFDFLLYYLPDIDMAQHKLGAAGRARRGGAAPTLDRAPRRRRAAGSTGSSSATASSCWPTMARRRRARRATCGPRCRACACSSARCARRRATAQVAVAASNRVCMLYRLADAPRLRDLAGRVGVLAGVDLAAFHEDGDVVVLRNGSRAAVPARRAAARPAGQRVDGDG